MTKKERQLLQAKIRVAKRRALVGVPKEIQALYLNLRTAKSKRSANEILREMRYEPPCV